jgi:hypothetical protein
VRRIGEVGTDRPLRVRLRRWEHPTRDATDSPNAAHGRCRSHGCGMRCGSGGCSSSTNGGVVPVAQSGTYAYRVTIPSPRPPQLPTDCSGVYLVLTDGSGTIESLGKSGSLYFTAGNWTGSLDGTNTLGCDWKVTLTPS